MCIVVSRGQIEVESTEIFARHLGGRQLLVYAMHLDTQEPAAMILPLPVAPGAGDDAVVFRDLSAIPRLFAELARGLPDVLASEPPGRSVVFAVPAASLPVHRVGSFEASFVPTRADFSRLDPRFRLRDEIWQKMPTYDDWGFVVFQFQPGAQDVHPMALEFAPRFPEWLYFPTVHVHDGELHPEATFDHRLYLQGVARASYRDLEFGAGLPDVHMPLYRGEASGRRAGQFMSLAVLKSGIVDAELPLLRLSLDGRLPNDDTWLRSDRSAA